MRKHKRKEHTEDNNLITEIFAEIEAIVKICIEEEYSKVYGFSPRKWFNIGKFKKRLDKLRKKYSED